MSISISTSDYKKTKSVEIDGVLFNVRPLNSSESVALMALKGDIEKMSDEKDGTDTVLKILTKLEDIFFAVFDKPEKAKKVLGDLGIEAWFEIYNKIMEG